ncbi:unnamed protein product, partial [Meganyctiphanes norvegica]
CIKHLLGVRKNTTTSLCLVELSFPTLKALVTQRQRKFFKTMWAERENMIDDPFPHAMRLAKNSNTSTARYLNSLIANDVDDKSQSMNNLYQEINNSQSSKSIFYRDINPNLCIHDIYSTKSTVNELERISWSKLRLSAHSLVIETGRWNRRGRERLPVENRLCQCGQVQTEHHVIEECVLSQDIRRRFNISTILELVSDRQNHSQVCHIVDSILNIYK